MGMLRGQLGMPGGLCPRRNSCPLGTTFDRVLPNGQSSEPRWEGILEACLPPLLFPKASVPIRRP